MGSGRALARFTVLCEAWLGVFLAHHSGSALKRRKCLVITTSSHDEGTESAHCAHTDFGRVVPPHPNPLPWGEGAFCGSLENSLAVTTRLPFGIRRSITSCPLSPSRNDAVQRILTTDPAGAGRMNTDEYAEVPDRHPPHQTVRPSWKQFLRRLSVYPCSSVSIRG